METKWLADIIPLTRFPWNGPTVFTYRVPKFLTDAAAGVVVKIPFRRSSCWGVIQKVYQDDGVPARYPLKEITGRAAIAQVPRPFLEACWEMARYTMNHPSAFLRTHCINIKTEDDKAARRKDGGKQKRAANHVQEKAYWWETRAEWERYLVEGIGPKKERGQRLIITPTGEGINRITALLKTRGVACEHFNQAMRAGAKKELYDKIINGVPLVIVGNRSALFLPLPHLTSVVVDDESHRAYKQDAPPPRYQVRRVARILCRQYGAPLTFLSPCPSVALVSEHQELLKQMKKSTLREFAFCELADMRTVNSARDLLHPWTREAVHQACAKGGRVLLVVGKKTYAHILRCQECGYVFRCTRCKGILTQETKTSDLSCLVCGYHELLSPLCPQCSGPRLSSVGFAMGKAREYCKEEGLTIREWHDTGLGVVLTTELPEHFETSDSFHMIVMTQADRLLARAGFMAHEHAFQKIWRLYTFASTLKARIIMQTAVPEHPVFKSLGKHDPTAWYSQELLLRRQFGYPPAKQLIRVDIPRTKKNEDPASIGKALRDGMRGLRYDITDAQRYFVRKKEMWRASMKIDGELDEQAWDVVYENLRRHLPAQAIVDVDPESV